MTFPHDLTGVRYSICRRRDLPEMRRLLADTFARNDPPAIAVGLTPAEFEAFVRVIARSAVTQRLSIVARDIATGELAGALLAEDSASPARDGFDRLSAKFEPIFDLFDQLEAQVSDDVPPMPGDSLHLFLIGVAPRFMGRGIARHLVTACLANGAELGYRMAVAEATNPTSQHILATLGFVTRAQCSYAEYRRDTHAVFASIAESGGPMAMSRSIGLAAGPLAVSGRPT